MTEATVGPLKRMAEVFNSDVTGQLSLLAGAAAVQLSEEKVPMFQVLVQNDPGSASNIVIGNATAQYIVLTAGLSITVPRNNLNVVYVKPVSGNATVNFWAMT